MLWYIKKIMWGDRRMRNENTESEKREENRRVSKAREGGRKGEERSVI